MRFILVALLPQHFAQVDGDFRIAAHGIGAAQRGFRRGQVTHAELHPAHAVHDERVARRHLQGFFDQRMGFRQADAPLGQRVAQGVIRMLIVGRQRHHAAQARFHQLEFIQALGQQGVVVQQLRIVGKAQQGVFQHRVGALHIAGVAQELRVDQQHLRLACRIVRFDFRQRLARRIEIAATRDQLGAAQARLDITA